MTKPETKAVAVKKEHSLQALPSDIDFASDMNEFGANYSQEQMTTPFLNVLQALSKAVTRGDAEYVVGAQPGMLFNTVTKEVFDGEKGVNLILSTFKESYIEWVPRNKGGGYVAEYDAVMGSQIKTLLDPDFKSIIQPGSAYGTPGNVLSLTHTRLGAIVSDELSTWSPIVLSMADSAIKVSKNLNSRHKLIEWTNPTTGEPGATGRCPMPLIMWTVKTITRKNDNGTWFTWDFNKKAFLYELDREKFLNLYRSIRDFASSARGQTIMQEAAEHSVTINQEPKNVSPGSDDQIPF